MAQLETVKIKAEGPKGYMIINNADFDKKKHAVWTEPKPSDGKGDGKWQSSSAQVPGGPPVSATTKN